MASQPANFQNIINFRDVGLTINKYLGQRRVREGIFFRSARIDAATTRDRSLLKEDLAIRTVIDLRTDTEHLRAQDKHRAHVELDASYEPQIPGITYNGIKITGRALELHILRQLSWWNIIKFLILFIIGRRLQAIRIITQHVLIPRGLLIMGLDTLDKSTSEIHQALCLYTDASTMPSIVHCTHGKDRTGLVCALVLMVLDIPLDAIEHDYFLTDAAFCGENNEMLAELRGVGLPDDWIKTRGDMITGIEEHLEFVYGGLDGYLDYIGFTKGQRVKIRENLLY